VSGAAGAGAGRPRATIADMVLTRPQIDELRKQLDASELLHHRIMAKMSDPKFDLADAWAQKERLDAAIGRFIRDAGASS
jgi:RNA-binding protein YhbY